MALRWGKTAWTALAVLILFMTLGQPAFAQITHEVPELEGVEIDEHPDALLPLDAAFKDENGREVKLGDYFDGRHPVVLNLAYYTCPMLCDLTMSGMVNSFIELPFSPGADFNIVTVSFDPADTTTAAKAKQQHYIQMYQRPSASASWHFLTGATPEIERLTSTIGFSYRWVPSQKQYAHPAAIYVLTPDGHISRYLYGVEFDPKTLKLALLEASQGKIGTTTDKILLYCYHYDPIGGKYVPVAMNIMRVSGVLTIIVLLAIILPLIALERHRRVTPPREAVK